MRSQQGPGSMLPNVTLQASHGSSTPYSPINMYKGLDWHGFAIANQRVHFFASRMFQLPLQLTKMIQNILILRLSKNIQGSEPIAEVPRASTATYDFLRSQFYNFPSRNNIKIVGRQRRRMDWSTLFSQHKANRRSHRNSSVLLGAGTYLEKMSRCPWGSYGRICDKPGTCRRPQVLAGNS